MKLASKLLIFIFTFVFLVSGLFIFIDYRLVLFDNVELSNYNYNTKDAELNFKIKKSLFNKDYDLLIYDGDNLLNKEKCFNNCNIKVNNLSNKSFELNRKHYHSKSYNFNDYINDEPKVDFNTKHYFLIKGESMNIIYNVDSLFNFNEKLDYIISDNEVVNIIDDKIVALKNGEADISNKYSDKTIHVTVSDLLELPKQDLVRKELLPCNKYSKEDNILFENILKFKVNNAGRKTRAGVVEAARFLTLNFPYRVPYFYENGRRYANSNYSVDGEGRYYFEGLYLNDFKKNQIFNTLAGPAIWGCPLLNYEQDRINGFYPRTYMPNGLDCSGFVSWAFINGGFDSGDLGAGVTYNSLDFTDLGEFIPITNDLFYSDRVKAGDLVSIDGHISIIAGIKNNEWYIAESLPEYSGVVINKYNTKNIYKYFDRLVLMDNYYKEDGNYSAFWK